MPQAVARNDPPSERQRGSHLESVCRGGAGAFARWNPTQWTCPPRQVRTSLRGAGGERACTPGGPERQAGPEWVGARAGIGLALARTASQSNAQACTPPACPRAPHPTWIQKARGEAGCALVCACVRIADGSCPQGLPPLSPSAGDLAVVPGMVVRACCCIANAVASIASSDSMTDLAAKVHPPPPPPPAPSAKGRSRCCARVLRTWWWLWWVACDTDASVHVAHC